MHLHTIIFPIFASLSGSLCTQIDTSFAQPVPTSYTQGLPFEMPEVRVPMFADGKVSIVDFGAVGDGQTMNTRAINEAIRSCAEKGGGSVIVPPGTWLTGPIKLQSKVNLHVERGALVQFSNKIEDFPLIAGFDGKSKHYIISPPISAYRCKNIAITGEGIFDGAGEVWRYVKKEKLTPRQWKQLTESGGVISSDGSEWWPSKQASEGQQYIASMEKSGRTLTAEDYAKAREYLRPDLVRLVQCEGILLDGPTFRNSPRYHVHPAQCEHLIIRNVNVQTSWYAQNGDGIDLSACRGVVIYHSTIDVGDDAICVKPSTIASSQRQGPSCEDIVIADCIVYHGHGGFVIGSESFGGARNISVRNCVFIGTDIGLRFKSLRGKGGLIENVYVDGIQMRAIENEAVLFDMYYGGDSPEVESAKKHDAGEAEPVTDRTPRFQNFEIKNIVCKGASRALLVIGLPEMPVKNITLSHLSMVASTGCLIQDADGIVIHDSHFSFTNGPAFSIVNGRNEKLDRVSIPPGTEIFLSVAGTRSENIEALHSDAERANRELECSPGVDANVVHFK
jgi:polygalacturonase